MSRLNLKRNLHTFAHFLLIALVVAALVTLWWANHTGMPDSWRAQIEQELVKHGAQVRIGALRFSPLRGLVADDVTVFADAAHKHELSRLERVTLDFDKTKLARGLMRLTKVELVKARVVLPVDPKNPDSRTLVVEDVSGAVAMPGGRLLQVSNARGRVAGIEVYLDARMLGYHQDTGDKQEDPDEGKRRELIADLIDRLDEWHFDPKQPPRLRLDVEGDLSDRSTFNATFNLEAKSLAKNGYTLRDVTAQGSLENNLLTLNTLKARDTAGTLTSSADYNLEDKDGRFDVACSLQLSELLKAWLGLPELRDVAVRGSQRIEAEGEFRLNEQNVPEIRTTGKLSCRNLILRNVNFDALEGTFSMREKDFYLRDLVFTREDGAAEGKVLIQWPMVRMALHTTFPPYVYRPLFKDQPLDLVLKDFGTLAGNKVDVNLEGGFDVTDKHSWVYAGSGRVEHLSFRGVPMISAQCGFSLNKHELDFFKGTAVFDYKDYSLRKLYDGPRQGAAKIGRIRYDAAAKLVEVENVEGPIWAAPLVRLFAPPIANILEEYRFHRPPDMKGSGVVDVTPQGRTNLAISFRSDQPANYRFLGEDVLLDHPSGDVLIRGTSVTVNDLKLNAFQSPVTARFESDGKGKLAGELTWTKASVPDVATTYGFQLKEGGEMTGRIEFDLTDGKIETMNGKGLLALEKAELFSVPMFGPLSGLISGILGDKHAGFERAKSAFFTYEIQNGILRSQDFHTSTSSLSFTGDGEVDLITRSVAMTIRMNTRGLLKLITLPLTPFYGLFQFRGTGPLKSPVWENVRFTDPPAVQNEVLFNPPKARVVTE